MSWMRTVRARTAWPLLAVAVLALLAPAVVAAAPPEWQLDTEHWYVLQIDGTTAGWMHERVESDGSRYRTATQTHVRIRRGAAPVEINTRSGFIETHRGDPVQLRTIERYGRMTMDSEWTFAADHITLTTRQGERQDTRTLPLPEGVWLTPRAAQRYWLQRHQAGAKEITYRTLAADHGVDPITVHSVLEGQGHEEVGGRRIPVSIWKTTVSHMPGITTKESYSTDGVNVRQEVQVPFGTMVTRLATQAEALAAADAKAPELLVETFVRPDKPIRSPARARRATLRLRARTGELPPLPAAGAQRVETGEDRTTALLRIDLDDHLPAPDEEAADAQFLEASVLVDCRDELVAALAARAARRAGDEPAARAEALRAFVHRYISRKGLTTAFASATETAKTKAGDCSEHAVLLCAMLRAQEIPARVASGLVYVPQFLGEREIFGWHMWTQALLDGAWVDLDATLTQPYHAAHILTSTSGLSDGTLTSEMTNVLLLMGNLEIEVVDVEYE